MKQAVRCFTFLVSLALVAGLLERPALAGTGTIEGSFEDGKGGARLTIKGTVPKWPDGARASVKLSVKDGADIDWYDLTVRGEAFSGKIDFANRKSAPIVYRAELWLRVSVQLPEAKDWFQRELSVSKEHSELLEACDIAVGTPDEQKKFHAEMIEKCADLLARAKANLESTLPAIEKAKDQDEWRSARYGIDQEARKLQAEYVTLAGTYVSLGKDAKFFFQTNHVTLVAREVLESAPDDPEAARALAEEEKARAEKVKEALEKARPEPEPALPKPDKPATPEGGK